MTVVKPGLPTLADLHVLPPPPRPTRKRSPPSDRVSPVAAEGLVTDHKQGCLGGSSPHKGSRQPLPGTGAGLLCLPAMPSGTHMASKVTVVGGWATPSGGMCATSSPTTGWSGSHLPA